MFTEKNVSIVNGDYMKMQLVFDIAVCIFMIVILADILDVRRDLIKMWKLTDKIIRLAERIVEDKEKDNEI